MPLPTIVPSDVLTPESGTGHGLLGRYWSNGEQAGAADTHAQVDPTVDVAGAPAASARSGRRAGPAR